MSKYYPARSILPARSSSPIRKAQPSPDTTVAINLRFFEDESKTQAERQYDTHYGQLPDPSEGTLDSKQRAIQKKKRKVRSAIVSRMKSAIYEKKLEKELQFRDSVNERLKEKVARYKRELDEIEKKIIYWQTELNSKTPESPQPSADHPAPTTAPITSSPSVLPAPTPSMMPMSVPLPTTNRRYGLPTQALPHPSPNPNALPALPVSSAPTSAQIPVVSTTPVTPIAPVSAAAAAASVTAASYEGVDQRFSPAPQPPPVHHHSVSTAPTTTTAATASMPLPAASAAMSAAMSPSLSNHRPPANTIQKPSNKSSSCRLPLLNNHDSSRVTFSPASSP